MAGDLKGQLEFEVEAGGASAKIAGLKRDLASLGRVAKEAGEASSAGMKEAAAAGDKAAGTLDRGSAALLSRVKRAIAEFSNGMRSSLDSGLAERLALVGDRNMAALRPWIEALRQIEHGYDELAAKQSQIEASNQRAAAAERALATIRAAADKAAKESFYKDKREKESAATERAERAERALAGIRAAADKAARDSFLKDKRDQEALATERAERAERALTGIRAAADKASRDSFLKDKRQQEAEATERAERAERALAGMRAVADKAAKDSFLKDKRDQEAAATERAERAERALAGIRAAADKAARDAFLKDKRDQETAATERAERAEKALNGVRAAAQKAARDSFLKDQREQEAAAAERAERAEKALAGMRAAAQNADREKYQQGQSFLNALRSQNDALEKQAAIAGKMASELLVADVMEKRLQASMAGVSKEAETEIQKFQQLKQGLQDLNRTAQGDAFIKSLRDRLNVGTTSPYERLLEQARQLGRIKEAEPLLKQLAEAEKGFTGMGKAARLSAQQLALVGPQFTDVITQLQMGTNPFTILIQQGGQLVDIYGGVGNALRGIGGFLRNLISPVTVVAGAVIALGAAYAKGQSQSAEFARTITLTGNAAGVTEGQYNAMATAIAGATETTIGSARKTLLSLVASGQFTGDTMRQAGVAVQLFSKVTGDSADSVAKRFIAAADGPAKFAQELNKQYNFLSASQIQLIKTMEDQGRTQEALKATFDALNERLRDAAQNFGTLERWWDILKRKGSEGIDFVLRIGRVKGVDELIQEVEEDLRKARGNASGKETFNPSVFGGNAESRVDGTADRRVQELEARRQALILDKEQQDQRADAAAKRAQGEKDVAAALELQGKNLDKNGQLTKALRDYATQVSRALMSTTLTEDQRKTLLANYDKNIAEIRERFKEPKGPSGTSAFNDANRAQVEAVKKAEAEKLAIIKEAQEAISLARATGQISEREAVEQTTQQDLRALETRRDALRQEAAIVAKKKDATGEAASLLRQADQLEEEITLRSLKGKNALIKLDYERVQAIRAVVEAQLQQQQLEELQGAAAAADRRGAAHADLLSRRDDMENEAKLLQLQVSMLGQTSVQRKIATEQLRIQLNLQQKLNELDRLDGDTEYLKNQARANAAKESALVANRVYLEEWDRTSQQIEQSLTDALMNGGKSGADYIKGLFRSMVLQPVIKAIVQPVAGTVASILTGGNAGAAGGGGSSGMGLLNNASTAYSLYGAATGSTVASLGNVIAGVGNAVGSGTISSFGYGVAGATPGAVGASGAAGASVGGALSSIGSAIPYVAAVVAILNAFGAFRSKKVVGNGLVGTVGDGGDLDVYSLIRRGGTLFSGPDYSIKTADADPKLTQNIQLAVDGMLNQTRAQAAVIGYGDALKTFTAPLGSELIHPEVGRYGIKLQGLTDEQAKAKIVEEVTKLQEKMAQQVIGTWETVTKKGVGFYGGSVTTEQVYKPSELAKVGESAFQTLQRLSSSLESVNRALDNFNDTLLATNLNSADAASKLVDLFGGVDQFNSAASSYFQRFFSDTERAAVATRQLSKAFADLGLGTLPSTKDAYRQLVNAQDLTTESGRKAYASLLSLSTVFADLKDAVEEASKSVAAEIDRLRGKSGGSDGAALQSQFAIKTAQARAGDSAALQSLPELTKALEEAAKSTATSSADLSYTRAALAASLSDTLHALKVPGFASGGDHAGGWRVVGEVGPELEYTPPSRIFNQQQAKGLVNTETMESLLTQLIQRFDAAKDQGLRTDTALVIQMKKVADTLQHVVYGGESIATRAGD